jgi:hypothetical protein
MDKRQYDPTWCKKLRNESVKKTRRGKNARSSVEKFDDWLWADETSLLPSFRPKNVEFRYRDSIGQMTERMVTVEAIIEKFGAVYLKTWCHTKNAERTFRITQIEHVVDLETGEVFENIPAWIRSI